MQQYIDADLLDRFDFENYGHALEILAESFPTEWSDILTCLRSLSIDADELLAAGGNESTIPKKFDDVLYPRGWREIRISGDLIVKMYQRLNEKSKKFSASDAFQEYRIENYIDGHNIDFIKGKVAFDLEWNSKDQTFDRDLLAMRTYFDCGLIDVGIIVTRAESLNDVFKVLDIRAKYGASTTHMDKLTYRLKSRRNGGCPILAVGIGSKVIKGL